MYKGIIFDSVQRNAFLSIAAREGLICENGFTDGVFDRVTCHNPSSTLQQTVLEQFTIAGAVYIDPFIYKCMDGELIQNGIIMPYEKCEHNMEGFFTFDVDTVQRMMEEKGLFYSIDEIDKMFYELQETIHEYVKLKNQYNLDYREIQIRRTLQLEPKADCHEVDIDSFIKLYDSIYRSPIFKVLEEYKNIFDIAYHNDLLSPVINATNQHFTDSFYRGKKDLVRDANEAIYILKYTSKRLDRIYTAYDLRGNVKLIQSDEAKAYRNKMDEWVSCISSQNYDKIKIVEEDIVKAQNAMKIMMNFQKCWEILGKMVATVGVISTALPRVLSYIDLPPELQSADLISKVTNASNEISANATYFGAFTTFINPTALFKIPYKKYLWTSFGIF